MYAMAGGSHVHGLIVVNLAGELRQALKKRPCFVAANDVRLRILEMGLSTYPDLIVIRPSLPTTGKTPFSIQH